MDTTHTLMRFGLTHQEARLYEALHGGGAATGYELAKATGISRSNTYAGLASLEEKGAAFVVDGKPVRYQAVPVAEFCGNVVRGLTAAAGELARLLAQPQREEEAAYLTVRGEKNIRDKVETLIADTASHIYLSMPGGELRLHLAALGRLAAAGKKVVVITDRPVELPGATVHLNPECSDAIRVIGDTASALTGSVPGEAGATCLFSRKENLVRLLRDSMANEIKLIEVKDRGAPPHTPPGGDPLDPAPAS